MELMFLCILFHVTAYTFSGSLNTATKLPDISDSQITITNFFTEPQNLENAITITKSPNKSEYSITTTNVPAMQDMQITTTLSEISGSDTKGIQLQETPESPTKPTQLLNIPPTDDLLHVSFLEMYRKNRQRFRCPVSVCDKDKLYATDTLDLPPQPNDSCCAGCSCDELCEMRGDCCPDRIENLFEPGRYPLGGMLACRQTSLKDLPEFDESMSGQFISKCDVTFIDEVTNQNCEKAPEKDLENAVPVSDQSTKEAYKNVYCAICNYVKEDYIVYWDVKIACTESSLIPYSLSNVLTQVLAEPTCNILFIPPTPWKKYRPASCVEVISTCNVSGDWALYDPIIEAGCVAYLSPFNMFQDTYRNIFCFLCNRPHSDVTFCGEEKREHPIFPSVSFAALLDFRPMQLQSPNIISDIRAVNCSSGFVYDHYQEECLEIVCPAMTELRGDNCERLLRSVEGLCLEAYVRINPVEPVYGGILDEAIFVFITESLITCQWNSMHINLYYQPAYGVSSVSNGQRAREYFVLHITTDDADCIDILANLDERGIVLNDTEYDYSVNATLHVYDVFSEVVETTGVKDAKFIGELLMPVGLETIHICYYPSMPLMITKFLVCPMVRLRIKDMSMFLRNGSIHISDTGLTLSKKDFIIDRNNILVCIDDYIPSTRSRIIRRKQETYTTDTVQSNIISLTTLACVCSSIISLLITLTVYIFLPSLRTQPGINNMFLSVSLLLALILFQFGAGRTEDASVCTVIGISIHFFWLNNIFWMNICCYHMFKVFGNLRLPQLSNVCVTTTVKYCLYCVSFSSFFVIINVVYSLSKESNRTLGYGKRLNMCYITSPNMVAFTMTLPTAMAVLVNFIMYIRVTCNIHGTRLESISSRQSHQNFSVYIKLSTLTGVAWLSFIPVYFTNHIVFECIFSVLVTSQGVFIMLAFICNKRVFTAFKNKLNRQRPGKSSSKYTKENNDTIVSTITSL